MEIDKDVPAFETFSDQEILNTVNNVDNHEADATDEEKINEINEVVDRKTMLQYISKMQMYFLHNNQDCTEYISQLDQMEKFLEAEQFKNQKQATIDHFFVKN